MQAAPQASGSLALVAVLDVIQFPLWWYSHGLVKALRTARHLVLGYERSLGVGIWVKNMFVPMFGQYDWQSRIISVFMRLMNIIGRGIGLVLVAFVILLGVLAYVALPILAGVFFVYHALAALIG
ncbi:MAG: hypothetical protein NUV56_02420 [Candidatus Uhrbacteria bacterium]|nr:hypothetical protein [Candidatus Uhrbacteria bacterium]